MTFFRPSFVNLLTLCLTAMGLLAAAPTSQAILLVSYDFETTGTGYVDPTSTGAGVTTASANAVGGFVRSGTSAPNGTGTAAIQFFNLDQVGLPSGTNASSDFISFTVSATTPGQSLDLQSLTFKTNLSATAAVSALYSVQYDDLSDGAGNFVNLALTPSTAQTSATVVNRSVDLSGAAFDNLTAGIVFRINFAKSAASTSTDSARVDLIELNGAVVPEPASGLLLLLGGIPLLRRRR